MDKFERAEAVKPLVEVALKLRSRFAVLPAVMQGGADVHRGQRCLRVLRKIRRHASRKV